MRIYSDNGTEYFNRICPYCKENVHIYRNGNKAILFDDKVYHFECFKKMKQVHKKCKNCDRARCNIREPGCEKRENCCSSVW